MDSLVIGTDVERGFIDFARAGNTGQGQTYKIQLKDQWLYCSRGMGSVVEN